VLLDSAREENAKGQSTVPACIGYDLNEFRHQFFVIALIESVDNDDHGLLHCDSSEESASRGLNGLDH
jgi:hypothetical protein